MSDHARKFSLDETPGDATRAAADGWVDMDVRWLVTRDTHGAEHGVVGLTNFTPGSRHELHRHPNCEEVEYVLAGVGTALIGDQAIELRPGEGVFVPVNEYHGFENNSDADVVLIWTYAGAASLEQAGYVTAAEDRAGAG